MELLIATSNRTKVDYLRDALGGLDLNLVSLEERDYVPPPDESANSAIGNAEIKAAYYGHHLGMWAVGVDNALHIPGLGTEQPGVFVRRDSATGQELSEEQVIERLIERVGRVGPSLSGVWTTGVAIYNPSRDQVTATEVHANRRFWASRSRERRAGMPLHSVQTAGQDNRFLAQLADEDVRALYFHETGAEIRSFVESVVSCSTGGFSHG